MGVIAKGILKGCQGLFTPVSLGYPLSVFNKNSTLKQTNKGVRKQKTKERKKVSVTGSLLKRRGPLLLRSGTVSWVLSGYSDVHHPLNLVIGRVFETQEKKKKSVKQVVLIEQTKYIKYCS